MQPLHITVKPQKVHGRLRWRVTWRSEGKTHRRYFPTKEQAEAFGAATRGDIRTLGAAWDVLTPGERAELVQAHTRAKAGGYSITEACRFWESHGAATAGAVTVGEMVNRCMDAKRLKGLRPESLRLLETTLKQFKADRDSRPASSITADEISSWVAGQKDWGQWRRRGALTDLRTLFSFAVKTGLLVRNVAAQVDRPIIDDARPEIFTPEQCDALLKLTWASYPKLMPWLSLALFAGIRPAELNRLTWQDVDLDGGLVNIGYATAKTRERRLVTIQPALKAWLEVCKKRTGAIVAGSTKMQNRLRAAFGTWPRDVLRHSFISYELERSKSASATAMQAGNTEEIIFKHYRELVKPADAEKFWASRPCP